MSLLTVRGAEVIADVRVMTGVQAPWNVIHPLHRRNVLGALHVCLDD